MTTNSRSINSLFSAERYSPLTTVHFNPFVPANATTTRAHK